MYEKYNAVFVGDRDAMLSQIKYKRRVYDNYIKTQLSCDKDAKILDCGCGFGVYLICMQQDGYRAAVGIDLSEDQVLAAKQHFGLSNVQIDDAFRYLESSTVPWDVILMLDLVEHLDVQSSIALLRLARDKLAPDGKIIIMTPNAIAPFSPYLYGDITHMRAYTVASLKQTARLAGFPDAQICGVEPIGVTLKSRLQCIVVKFIYTPLIRLVCKSYYGWDLWGIYSANLLCILRGSDKSVKSGNASGVVKS